MPASTSMWSMKRYLRTALITQIGLVSLIGLASLIGAGCSHTPVVECRASATATPICGFTKPEDLVSAPDGAFLVSQMGTTDGAQSGSLARFDLASQRIEVLYPTSASPITPAAESAWGSERCPGPIGTELSPHGIHLKRRNDGHLQLAVVNHGSRESVEFFELSAGGRSLVWRGCVPVAEPLFINAVVGTASGGFLATHMLRRRSRFAMGMDLFWAKLGANTGHVIGWQPGGEVETVPGTEGRFPNGIEISEDEEHFFVNYYLGNRVTRFPYLGDGPTKSAAIRAPDNIRASPGGMYLIASHLESVTRCKTQHRGACPSEFAVVALDPESMTTRTIFRHWGPPMGAASVAIYSKDHLWMGSFIGDRLMRVPATSRQTAPERVGAE